jgi:hypothetical protein
MNRHILFFATAAALLLPIPAAAQELQRTFNLNATGEVSVSSELIVKASHSHEFRYTPLDAGERGKITAWDVSRGTEMPVHISEKHAKIVLPAISSEKAETRIRIEETIPATGLTFRRTLARGRYVFNLPDGYVVDSCSLPSQIETPGGHVVVGIVQGSEIPAPLSLTIRKGVAATMVAFKGNFTAEDNRYVSYQLLDPSDHKIRLWLEMYVDKPGQSHFYSQLRMADHTSDPVTLDVDRGIELPTRIVSGKEANAIGDSPSPFHDDALVLVADLGYGIPEGGSARLRSFQTATDPDNYRLIGPDEFRLDRFIARTRTQYILPAGWSLESMDQAGTLSTTPDGRVVIDFVSASAQGSNLVLIAHRNAGSDAAVR